VSKWTETDQDNLRIGTAKAVARLMSFAQITCCFQDKSPYGTEKQNGKTHNVAYGGGWTNRSQ